MKRIFLLVVLAVTGCAPGIPTPRAPEQNRYPHHVRGDLVAEDDSTNGTRCYRWAGYLEAISCVPLRDTTEAK